VMAISVISISSDSSEESVGTYTARVILFDTIPTTIPSTTPIVDLPVIHDDTLWIPTDTPTISPVVPTIPPVAPTIQYTSPFICTDLSDSDTFERPPSEPIPVGQLYRTQPNGVLKMLTARKSVGSLPTHRLASRYPSYSSSLDHFTSDDSSRDSPSDSLSKTSSDSSSRHSFIRSPTSSVPVASPVHRALSPVHANLLPPPMRIRDSDSMTDFEVSLEEGYVPYVPREIGLGVDVEDTIIARGMNVRVVVETVAEEEVKSSTRGTVKVEVDPRVGPVIDDDVRESIREDVLDHVTIDG
ncbi:hypothetical protein Tco_1450410, partial [Tanacetum coccineum]